MTTIVQNPKSPTGNPGPPPVPAVKPKGFPRGKTPREISDQQVKDYQERHGRL